MQDPVARARRITARDALRHILGGYLGKAAEAVLLADGARGMPRLSPPDSESGLTFNLSHAGDAALCAVGAGAELGIDLECEKPRAAIDRLARRCFVPEESAAFLGAPQSGRVAAFYRIWTVKESVLKASGQGIQGRLRSVIVGLGSDGRPVLIDAPGGAAAWTLKVFRPEPGHTAACAVRGPVEIWRFFVWEWGAAPSETHRLPARE